MRLSNTMLNTYVQCPLQAKFHYFDHLPTKKSSSMAFGICVHAALEQFNITGDLEDAQAFFKDIWDNPEKVGATVERWDKRTNHESFRALGIEMLKDYAEKLWFEDREVIAQEHRFLVPMGEHELTGVVDLLEVRKGGRGKNVLRIVDYKTNSRKPSHEALYMNTQFTIYDWASRQPEFWLGNGEDFPPIAANAQELWERFQPSFPRRGIWLHLRDAREIDAGPRDDADFERMYRTVTEIAKAVEHEVFIPCISADTCLRCDYTVECRVEIPDIKAKRDGDDGFF